MNIKQQTSKDKVWLDEKGEAVPSNRLHAIEKKKEKVAYTLATEALKVNGMLLSFKKLIREKCDDIFREVMSEPNSPKIKKGNYTWYNFNGSVRVEVCINDLIRFDTLEIEKAKQLLLEMVNEGIRSDRAFIKRLVVSAFENTNGQLDTKRVLGLKKHASHIGDSRYHKAMEIIDKSIRTPESKTYYRVAVKNEAGEYETINLNFSSI